MDSLADRFRAFSATVAPGEDFVLDAGSYAGGLIIARGGTANRPLVVRAHDASRPPHIGASSSSRFLIDVQADHIVIRGLTFGPTPAGVHGVVLRGASHVTIEDCRFEDMGGLAIVETMTATDIVVRRNEIERSRTTAMYFGCHGGGCSVTDLLVECNHIRDVTAPGSGIGYGIQVKLNSSAIIRDNVVVGTKGPAIMAYGAQDPRLQSRIERNVVSGSRRSSGIVIGGGPAIVRGNIAIENAEAGIALEDYGRRGFLREIEVRENVAYANRRAGIMIRGRRVETTLVKNIVHSRPRTPAFPTARPGLVMRDNVAKSVGGSPC